MQNTAIVAGFADPVSDAQQTFRKVLKAMSEPGVIVEAASPEALEHLYPSTFAVCQTLLDQQTPLWLSKEFSNPKIQHNLHFHTGMPLARQPLDAQFALAYAGEIATLDDFAKGTAEYPERNCTMILQVQAISASPSTDQNSTTLKLSGPGIKTERQIAIAGLSQAVIRYLSDRPDTFPLGIDFIFTAAQSLVAIPRTTQLEVC
ncbi:phosphonate C-P lyase system protein PhnH [Sedimenticola selenatireducens]|uniref:Phosphonate C-P lyase system protein PhnH n=1 Tax=Sedimenticola selenatireducens TaxID=191960 RepID=A0A558DW88_9GAMM|nr:phosphonate C-P lyase system protein PhnH [Sedimenticola selenatireducens]TVO77863.1 phosphonate C-P lyase system protein PhnH [Sedimenticola selenatireducens]TVT65168.1 MAG: phosphonate C-P lyase system protein PhnH [Sedimenticola selenatireducens]